MEICLPSGLVRFSGTVNRPHVYSGPSASCGSPFQTGSGHEPSAYAYGPIGTGPSGAGVDGAVELAVGVDGAVELAGGVDGPGEPLPDGALGGITHPVTATSASTSGAHQDVGRPNLAVNSM